ncbi:MAG TPA: TIGR00725 family protein [Chloroflexi bacterium]|nr:TIGR00725 family protein [Chloroflexota bacterium]
MIIAVVGAGSCSDTVARQAEEVGRLLADRGSVLVCGGLGGVMEAACRGAQTAGGLTVGILPGRSRGDANPYVVVPVVTGMGEARNVIVVSSGQAVIAIDGGYGTLSEVAHALKLGIPVVGLGSGDFGGEGWEGIRGVTPAADPTDAVEKALALSIE